MIILDEFNNYKTLFIFIGDDEKFQGRRTGNQEIENLISQRKDI